MTYIVDAEFTEAILQDLQKLRPQSGRCKSEYGDVKSPLQPRTGLKTRHYKVQRRSSFFSTLAKSRSLVARGEWEKLETRKRKLESRKGRFGVTSSRIQRCVLNFRGLSAAEEGKKHGSKDPPLQRVLEGVSDRILDNDLIPAVVRDGVVEQLRRFWVQFLAVFLGDLGGHLLEHLAGLGA